VIKKPTVIVIFALAVLIGLYASATPADRDRWLAALWLSKKAAARVQDDLAAERKAAAEQQEERERRRAYAAFEPEGSDGAGGAQTSAVLDPEQACAQYRAVKRLRDASGRAPQQANSKLHQELQARCGGH
jgi:hypothetical protein